MDRITKKGEIEVIIRRVLASEDVESMAKVLLKDILSFKVKFPLLEYAAHLLIDGLPSRYIYKMCDEVAAFNTIGGNVIIGIMLQSRLNSDKASALHYASKYMDQGAEWYVTDIIGERVFGYGMLMYFDEVFILIQQYAQHDSKWVVRAVGAGGHYAIKKGLDKESVDRLFELLISLANARDHHIKTGIGWAAKTTARFHPEIIDKYRPLIIAGEGVGRWFIRKVNIGLKRHAYFNLI